MICKFWIPSRTDTEHLDAVSTHSEREVNILHCSSVIAEYDYRLASFEAATHIVSKPGDQLLPLVYNSKLANLRILGLRNLRIASRHILKRVQEGHHPHDSIAFNSANPAAISPSNFSISAMISSGGRCSTSSCTISLYLFSDRS